jgi:NAD(P)-dependent dehydrogenase (short-subunit alcohol dehydrogenase family)
MVVVGSKVSRGDAMKVELEGRSALVTGAGRGIGRAIADALATNGAIVAYTDVDFGTAKQSAAEAPGGRAIGLPLDVTDATSVELAVSALAEAFGKIDILVNNAGVNTLRHRVTIDEFPIEEWERILAVDLDGVFRVSQGVSKVMKRQGSGRIINIASIAGLVPLRLQCAFVAAKAGVVNLTKGMALELGPHGILVNGIAPGSIVTDGTKALFYGESGQFKDNVQALMAHIPLGRPGTVAEVAHAALFLAAPESSYINGHILTVDGGWTAGYAREF